LRKIFADIFLVFFRAKHKYLNIGAANNRAQHKYLYYFKLKDCKSTSNLLLLHQN